MAITQERSRRKASGGYYTKKSLMNRKASMGRTPAMSKVSDERKIKIIRTQGGNQKVRILREQFANVKDKNNKWVKAKIKVVLENVANRNFVRRNVLTKGAVVDTDKGKVKITSRPGQDGVINAELI